MSYNRHNTNQQDHMTVRQIMTSAPKKKAARKGSATKVYAEYVPKAAAKKAAAKKAAPSTAAIMLNDLGPSVKALHDRVEKLRLRFA